MQTRREQIQGEMEEKIVLHGYANSLAFEE